jgi:two-component system, NtrC family, sensor histidine kinase HydH
MNAGKLRLPLALQIGAVIALFAGALGTLGYASSSVVGREERRAWANARLKLAGDLLQSEGKSAIAEVRPYPDYMEPGDWVAIDRRLAGAASLVRARFPGVEGGYYLPDRREQPFLPALPAMDRPPDDQEDQQAAPPPGRNLYDYIETQADAAYRKKYDLLVVEDIPPDTVAIQAAPIRAGGRVVAAAWTMTRLVDPVFLDRPAAVYRLFAGLALAGIALSTGLTYNLVRTVRRQAAERDRLQFDLRRSERLAALGRLLAGVAHEVRNPLAGIRSTAQLWQRGLGIDGESLDGLIHEVDRLEEIVSSLLQFSRADAQDLAVGDLNAVLVEAARLAAGPAEAKGVRVELDLDEDLSPVVMAPPALIQVFRNLTTNAIQAMPGGGTIRLRTRNDSSLRAVLADVADTGPGMTAEAIGHLFEPFFTTKAEGTGLGLAIAREIALAHRGDLRAANRQDGSGAIFTLTLPSALSGRDGEPR